MSLFGLEQSGDLGTFPCFFGTDKCQTYKNGTVIWHNRGGGAKRTQKGTVRKGWTITRWVSPYFKCLSCGEKVEFHKSKPILTRYYNNNNPLFSKDGNQTDTNIF